MNTKKEQIDNIINSAIEFGVKSWGRKEVMAIQIGLYWAEGFMEAAQCSNELKTEVREKINNYHF